MRNILLLSIFSLLATAQCFKQLSLGGDHIVVVGANNELSGWGRTSGNSLGINQSIPNFVASPILINNQSEWSKVWATGLNTFVQKSDETLWGFGSNNLGSLGIGNIFPTHLITPITTGVGWTKILSTQSHSLGLRADGTIWAWGDNNNGRCAQGIGAPTQLLVPTQIGTANHWIDIAVSCCGSFAVRNDGTIWGAGGALTQFLGPGNDPSNVLRQAIPSFFTPPITDIAKIKAGTGFMLAQKTDGTLLVWGQNDYGQLAMPLSYFGGSIPIEIGTDTWKDFAVGQSFALAIKSDGTLWAWGRNHFGQLGLGHTDNVTSPTQVGIDNQWDRIYAGGQYTALGVKTDGSVWVWGRNEYGQFGNGTTTQSNVPIQSTGICVQTLGTSFTVAPKSVAYPNPTHDWINLQFESPGLLDAIEVYNMQGHLVQQQALDTSQSLFTVSLQSLSQGLYLVVGKKQGQRVVQQRVVRK
ncbi:MAG: T9SS type A sorting domain-containing protein [Flavobacteriales bacterium]|nr:T9SS type A sorting domain-containing protein [Flavobacteriales bacterium]